MRGNKRKGESPKGYGTGTSSLLFSRLDKAHRFVRDEVAGDVAIVVVVEMVHPHLDLAGDEPEGEQKKVADKSPEWTQDECYWEEELDEGFDNTLTHDRGCRSPDDEFSCQTRVFRQDSRAIYGRVSTCAVSKLERAKGFEPSTLTLAT
jgi:hypothetical protein